MPAQKPAEQAEQDKKTPPRIKFSIFLFVAFVLMAVAITYIWP
jgi:hypothetical protein